MQQSPDRIRKIVSLVTRRCFEANSAAGSSLATEALIYGGRFRPNLPGKN